MVFSTASFITQVAVLVLALALLHKPLGLYMARVFTNTKHSRPEKILYRLAGVDSGTEQSWSVYLRSVLLFSLISILVIFALQRLQGVLPGSNSLPGVDPWVAMNTAISFVTNTNWQTYVPEATVGIFVQMCLLAVQNFLSAAVGIVVVVALIRGISRTATDRLGNFWVDLARASFRILLPIATVAAIALVIGGVVQNFWSTEVTNAATGVSQTIPGGPVASQEAIKVLGTNGGGYFNANSAHPLENPNVFTSLFQVFLILLIPSALPYMYGRMVGDQRQGYTVAGVMGALWLTSTCLMAWAVSSAQGVATAEAGGLGEGFEQRLGPVASSIFAASTTLTSTGAVNVAHDSLPPLAGGVAMLNMMLGEVAPGGTGSGLYGMLMLAIIAVFIAGLMVGRTPEFLGKKITPREMKLAALYILVTPTLVLVLAGISALLPDVMANAPASGPHQFSELLYAFTSGANNNGSAFGGITSSGPYLSTLLGLAMLLGRFLPIALVLALAGSLARQRRVPVSSGTVPTHGPLFGSLLLGVTVILTALSYFPALALGPLAEGLIK
ncbi:potassium-transporting ATPase subunit KdpA [Paenarthrobacter aurescens]|uniref:Potassium-transporting ATPase potassium-binding subunit n=1 Tax=Paenarthrobacter aurescens TaxID=43663 RepID=A0A4Y3NFG8_PAEAU|nr:potassium-transporting ATPase subunit KdpA [Paenarthrobacter aurescens]MDO6144568.1 potassium-transporting ATPase subunit KdpA [Paenarthrobacter aurescens]MDO6148413.1 potassium-transporting ATPase subunit KdpA [Paenarthrobacter aurescens]MDO6159659.1 potassium-transporting ATPase subunit KdpA [Paenarthrobacter aurescens]MDO6164561.1 potassium-transporting ATPase subunit KdpA [Paenarthrobacter aurescens]GEB17771.1 potassium-transporting ATPase potassium-binding subunit [Paenarthrobacter aur